MTVATSIIFGPQATPDLAAQAVTAAMQKAEITVANSVLLYLTDAFSKNPQPAIKAAAQAGRCTQVMGCTAPGIFNEDDWVLDAPAAAAMVFSGDISLQTGRQSSPPQPRLTLCAPNAINSTWLHDDHIRYGGVSGDATGQGHFAVWQNAKGNLSGYVDASFNGAHPMSQASHGLQLFTQPSQIRQVSGFDIMQLGAPGATFTPYVNLNKAWLAYCKGAKDLPLHRIMTAYANQAEDLQRGEYNLTQIITYDDITGSVTLAEPLKAGQYISWGLRDQQVTEADMHITTCQLRERLAATPLFGLLFSSLARGPYFYDGVDRDLKVITKQLTGMPLLGFYGNGAIVPNHNKNALLQSSAVLSLFKTTNACKKTV